MPASSETRSEASVTLPAGVDLHARPAAELVKAALRFRASIEVQAGDRVADAKSLLGVLGLGARAGTALRLRADGDDAAPALDALTGLVAAFQ